GGDLGFAVEAVVADVVDPAGERVDRAHRLALWPWQQPDPVVEVRGSPPGDLLATLVRPLDLDRGSVHRPSTACSHRRTNAGLPGRGRAASTSYRARSSASSAALPPATNPATASRGRSGSVPDSGAPASSSWRERAVSNASTSRSGAATASAPSSVSSHPNRAMSSRGRYTRPRA